MAITGAQLVADAMFQCGALGQDGTTSTVPDNDQQLVLRWINRVLESWSAESMIIYTVTSKTLALTPTVGTYSTALLSGGGIRPVNIGSINVSYAGVNYPIEKIDAAAYSEIGIPTIAAIPSVVYIDMGMPNATLTFFPTPYAAMTANIDCEDLLVGTPVTVASTISLPPGYEEALVAAVGVAIAPSFGVPVSNDMRIAAQRSLARLKIRNFVPMESRTDFDRDSSYDLAYICRPW